MTDQPFPSRQRRPDPSLSGRPEPVYVDEAFEDEPADTTADEPEAAPKPDELERVEDELENPAGSAVPDEPEAPAEAPGPAAAVRPEADRGANGSGRSFESRIPHRHAAPKTAARRVPAPAPVRSHSPAEQGPPTGVEAVPPEKLPAAESSQRAVTEADTAPQRPGRSAPIRRTARPDREPPIASETSDPARPAEPVPAWVVLDTLLAENAGLPEGSLILGVQDDGKPLVLALDDASMGAVLVTGDSADANRKHLRAILASAEKLNPPDLLQVDVITRAKERFETTSSVLGRICEASDTCVYELLAEFLDEIETRLRDERQLPFRILVLDEIEELTGRLAEDSLRFLRWMMRRGPQAGIWIFASIETDRLPEFDSKTFRAFDLRLYGRIREQAAAERYTEISPGLLRKLASGSEGCFKFDDAVIRFSIPELAG